MGNNPSKGPTGEIPTASSPSTPPPSTERKVTRQPSLNSSSNTFKATAVDPSASKETATGLSTSQSQAPAQQRLQSRKSPEPASRNVPESKKPEASPRDISAPDPSNPVQVPVARAAARHDPYPHVAPSAPPHNTYYNASTHLQRPPRMPLPIGDATATPGSPIIGPDDSYMGSPPSDPLLDQGAGPRESNLTNTIADDDELLDDLQPNASTGVGRAVPTIIEWTAPGDKVYVTGTFVNWEKKFRLHKGDNASGVLSANLNLRPGTHHLKFIVDGEMRASDNLPTAVDFTNHLVNYVEVSADDVNRSRSHSDRASRNAATPGIQTPQVPSDLVGTSQDESNIEDQSEKEEPEEVPMGDFHGILPQFLVDLDREDETQETPAYQQAVNIIGEAPTPPSLPLFLGKSILNGTTPMKDDSSVLNYPNHTVLNHLATSSIKNGVLATSVTTRYKRKYVTTILYKPTGDITG